MILNHLKTFIFLALFFSFNADSSYVLFNDSESGISDKESIILDSIKSQIDVDTYLLTSDEIKTCIADQSCFEYIRINYPQSNILQVDYFEQNESIYLIFSVWDHQTKSLQSSNSITCESCSTLQLISLISEYEFNLLNIWNDQEVLVIRPSMKYSYNQPEINFDEDYFTIEINPTPKARVKIDGEDYGMSPIQVSSTEKKTVNVELDIDNHESFAKKVRFGKDKKVTTKLKELLANLRVDSSPTGATVYINGSRKGRTPTDIKKISMNESLDIRLELKNYVEYEFNFTALKSGDNYEKISLERGQGYLRIVPDTGFSSDKISIRINGNNRGMLRNLSNSGEWNEGRKTLILYSGKNDLEVTYDGVTRKNSVKIETDEIFEEDWEVNFQDKVDVTITF